MDPIVAIAQALYEAYRRSHARAVERELPEFDDLDENVERVQWLAVAREACAMSKEIAAIAKVVRS